MPCEQVDPANRQCRLTADTDSVSAQVEKAGGYSSADGQCISSLDVPITEYDQRTQVRA